MMRVMTGKPQAVVKSRVKSGTDVKRTSCPGSLEMSKDILEWYTIFQQEM
jgi:hypothetical protein